MKLKWPSRLMSMLMVSSFAYRVVAQVKQVKPLSTEDEQFWNRYLGASSGFSVATKPPINGSCKVTVGISCKSSSGQQCDKIGPPNQICANGSAITTLTFSLTGGRPCNPSGNGQGSQTICKDFAPLDSSGTPVNVYCKNAQNGADLVIEPKAVPLGSTFTVSTDAGGNLPAHIDCIYVNSSNAKVQENIIDTSGKTPLNLNDQFGAFTLLSCGSQSGGIHTCIETLRYKINVSNVGTVPMDITVIDFFFNMMTTSLLGDLKLNPVPPGKSTSLRPELAVDICGKQGFSAKINVKANAPSGQVCQATDRYSFTVSVSPTQLAPTPAPMGNSQTPPSAPQVPPTPIPQVPSAPSPEVPPSPFPQVPSPPPPSAPSVKSPQIPSAPSPQVAPLLAPQLAPASVSAPQIPPASAPQGSPATAPQVHPAPIPHVPSASAPPASAKSPQIPSAPIPQVAPFLGPQVAPASVSAPQIPSASSPQVSPASAPQIPPASAPRSSPATAPQIPPASAPQGSPGTAPQGSPGIAPQVSPASVPQIPPASSPQVSPASSPHIPPASAPQGSPVLAPQGAPASAPQVFPASSPQIPPASAPQVSPTSAPQISPVPAPQASSVPPPTPVPRVNCNVNVSIDCMTQGGRDCAAIKPPNQICSDGTPLENITFGYTGSSCQSIDNQQANKTYCIDFAPIPNEVVNILCKNPSNGMALGVEPSKVQPGSVFIVYPLLCGSLPEKIDCIILDNNNTKLQQLIIDTSGNVPLKLKNNFGAFTLESCVTQRGEKSCLETLRYDINVDNIGTVAMTITVLDFIFNKMTVNLLGEVGLNPVPPGQSTALQPMLKVDICAGEEYSAKVNVEATPPNGEKCQATDQYAFTIPKPQVDCSLGVNFNCSTQDGGDCTAIKPPTCSDGTPVESLTINFTGSVCMPNSNKQGNESRCVDSAPFMNDNATVLCKDISNGFDVMVQPSNVQPGDTFQVIAGLCGSLPAKIDCIIFDKTGTKIQETVIDTSGTVPLNLNDRFGGFTVQTCVTQRGEKSCLHTLNYDITVANVGSVEMDVTVVDFLFEKSTTSLLGNLQLNPIPTGKSTLLNPKRDINICTNESFFAQVSVAANSPSGGMCQATAQYAFMVTLPPPPAPRAAPALSPMTNIPAVPFALAPQVPPDLPPTNLPINIMPTRRPSSLAPSANALMTACQLKADTICETLQPGNLTGRCEDIKNPNNVTCSNGSIPTSVSFAYQAKGGATNITVKVTVHGAEMSIFVRDGGIFTVGGNLTNGLTLSIDGIGSKTIDTSCSVGNDLTLGNQFGPLELIGFQNKDGDFTSVYIVRVSYLVQNVGPNDADVDSVIITSELSNGGASFNALSSTQDIHRGATQLIFNETQLVDALQKFSQNHTFIFRSDVTGKSRIGGLPCQANATYSF